jgi:hypothetical protein
MLIKSYFPTTLEIDGVDLQLRIARFDVKQAHHFERLLTRARRKDADRMLLIRKPGAELERQHMTAMTAEGLAEFRAAIEALRQRLRSPGPDEVPPTAEEVLKGLELVAPLLQPTDQFIVDDEEIRRRRWAELDDAGRKKYDALVREDEEAFDLFVTEALGRYVRVDPGMEFEHEAADGTVTVQPVKTGADLSRCFGGRQDFISALVRRVREENRIGDALKNALRSRSASAPSSSANDRDRTASGGSTSPDQMGSPSDPPAGASAMPVRAVESPDGVTSAAATASTEA